MFDHITLKLGDSSIKTDIILLLGFSFVTGFIDYI